MLHIVNKSPAADARRSHSCLRLAKPGSALLLIEDARLRRHHGHGAAELGHRAGA
ncbi:MAG: hypothetical protein MZV65_15250 [Chromatiales bacterium]|nr:hypothetical protein [Chromatiales bacterium]